MEDTSSTERKSTKITASADVIDEFKSLVENLEGSVRGNYSRHVEQAMRMYIDAKRGLDEDKRLRSLSRRMDLVLDELGVSETKPDTEYVTENLTREFQHHDGIDPDDIEELVERYAEYSLPRDEVQDAVAEKLYKQLDVRPIRSVSRGERVTIEGNVISCVDKKTSKRGYIADRTDSIRFDSSVGLTKGRTYRIEGVKVIDRRETVQDSRSERVLRILDGDDVTQLRGPGETVKGFSGSFEGYGVITGFDLDSSGESKSTVGARLVAYLDDGGRVYRTRMDEKILLDDIHGGDASSDWTEIIDQAMEKLYGRYCTVSGYLNEEMDSNSAGFSGLVAGELRWGVRGDFMPETPPSFEVRPKPHVRVFNAELNRTTAATDYGGQEGRVNYALLPTGHKANKVLVVGTLSRIRSTGKAIGGRLTDATGSTVEFFVPKEERPQVASSLLNLRESGLPCRIGLLANVRPGDNSEVIVSAKNFFEADEFVEETWIRETVERTRQRVLEKPYEDETGSEYGVPPRKVWNDVKRRLVKNSRVGSQVV